MLKIIACRCLLKNFKYHRCLKYLEFSTGSDNDQNDKDKSAHKSKNNKTNNTETDQALNTLKTTLNNLFPKNGNIQQNNASPKKTSDTIRQRKEKINSESIKLKADKAGSYSLEFKEILSKSVMKNRDSIKKDDDTDSNFIKQKIAKAESDSIKMKEILSKSFTKNIESKDNINKEKTDSDSIKLKDDLPKSDVRDGDISKPDPSIIQKENTVLDSIQFKEILTKFSTNNTKIKVPATESIKLKKVLSRNIIKSDTNAQTEKTDKDSKYLKNILFKFDRESDVKNNSEDEKKESSDFSITKFKEIVSKSVSSLNDNKRENDSNFAFENFNKKTTLDSNDQKSEIPMALENFKNLLSSCKVNVATQSVDKKEVLDKEMSIAEYLNSILKVDLIFKDYQMEDNINPFFTEKPDTDEDFVKIINELVLGDTSKIAVKFDFNEKSFISLNEPAMRLNIFKKSASEIKQEKESLTPIIDLIESHEYRKMNSNLPSSYFHECIQLTKDKIMRNFPIDNDQDSEELNIGFHEHVFPQQYLTGNLPTTGVIGQFLNYVCLGLSQNPHLTAEQKKAHIIWYEQYLSDKQKEIELAAKKSMKDLEFEKQLRNK